MAQEGVKCCRKQGLPRRIGYFATGRIELHAERIANPQILLIVPQDNLFLPQGSYIWRRRALNGEKSFFQALPILALTQKPFSGYCSCSFYLEWNCYCFYIGISLAPIFLM
ncbi:hypothetical protein BZG01_10130 [Labilibaculum manganireducens]|uniref:Uncharacterized protein n=1 Tax=Labilibaculum manganireducens TaxID=1940525 RepID=A0A2N3I8K8_9BACT|nr:hypothetical protein BZG01_10130 [Labilibaculum manganireducens]